MVGVLREVFGQRLELSTSLEWGRAAQPFRSPVGACERSDVEIPCFTKNCTRYDARTHARTLARGTLDESRALAPCCCWSRHRRETAGRGPGRSLQLCESSRSALTVHENEVVGVCV